MTSRTWLLTLWLCTPAVALGFDDDGTDGSSPRAAPEHGKAATADASPVDRGVVEVEFSYTPAWNDRGFDSADAGYAHGFAGTLTYGAATDVDVKLSTGFASVYAPVPQGTATPAPSRGAGPSDLAFGTRWRFLNLAAQALELALTLDVVLPTGSQTTADELGLSQGFWSARTALVATKDLGPITANGEIAWMVPVSGDADGLRSVAQVNGAIGWQLTPWLQPELELNYQATLGPDAHVLGFTAGMIAPIGGHRLVAAIQRSLWALNTPETTSAGFFFKTAL